MSEAALLNPEAVMGDNRPPVSLTEDLQARYKGMLDQFAELTDAASQAPEKIADDITHAKVLELIKKMRVLEKQADGTREIEREPHAQKVAEVNGFFKSRIDPLKTLRERLNERHEAYSKAKAEAEKRRLEEEAERRREAERQALIAAAAAERKKREAEEAQRKAEEEARQAESARQRAVAEQKAAEERVATAKAEEARLAAKRVADAAAAAKQKELDEAAAAEREAQRKADAEAAAAAKANRQAEEAAALKSKESAAAALKDQREAETAAAAARQDAKSAGRDERSALNEAVREDRRATKIEDKAEGPEADLARSRSEHGAVGTLTRHWTCRVVDRDKIDRAALWPHINGEAIEAALWKWMMAQPQDKRVMAGAVMEEQTVGIVR